MKGIREREKVSRIYSRDLFSLRFQSVSPIVHFQSRISGFVISSFMRTLRILDRVFFVVDIEGSQKIFVRSNVPLFLLLGENCRQTACSPKIRYES